MSASLMARRFDVPGQMVSVRPFGSGNINDTYLAVFRTHFSEERFVLQRLNTKVFRRPESLMQNMRRVTEHVHDRLRAEERTADRIWQLPRIIPTTDGKDFAYDGNGQCWRAISLIASAEAYDCVQSPSHAYEAGMVLGQFQRLISDLDPSQLSDPLPGYHITPEYLAAYDAARAAEEGTTRLRASAEAKRCCEFVEARREFCSVLEDAKERGELPIRPVHGDPKLANIMIDEDTGKGTAIIDLDTVKPGLVHYDFGDCLRSACNVAGEETVDFDRVTFDPDLCRRIVDGYMAHAADFLTEADRHYLFDAIRLIALELGLRFLTDFLAGDVYFKTRFFGHNLNRAKVQFRVVESIEEQEGVIRGILEE